MIPSPPTPASIVMGLSLALRMALGQEEPGRLKTRFEKMWGKAVWEALWFRLILLVANGTLMVGLDHLNLIPLLVVVALVDTLSYPVVSHFALQAIGMAERFPLFILSMTLVGNLRIILIMTTLLATGGGSGMAGNIIMLAVAVWMIWAAWFAASRSLGRKGWLGAGMLVLMMFTEILNALVILTFVQPLADGISQ